MEINHTQPKEEQIVGSWLKSNGYFRITPCDKMDIEADSSMRRIFVHIETIYKKDNISNSDIQKIKRKAIERNREPWLAILELDKEDDSNYIEWMNLTNK